MSVIYFYVVFIIIEPVFSLLPLPIFPLLVPSVIASSAGSYGI